MKTPDEIKKGLECCGTTIAEGRRTTCNAQCPYINEGIFCRNVLHGDTESYIIQLELFVSQVSKALCCKENATICEVLDAASQVKSRLGQVERERDALMESAKGCCETCAFVGDCAKHDPDPTSTGAWWYDDCEEWEWRGVCPENTKEKST